MVAAIAACLETITDRSIPNMFRLSFGVTTSPKAAEQYWKPIVDAMTPLANQLEDAFTHRLSSTDRVQRALQKYQGIIAATVTSNLQLYKEFTSKIK